MRWSVTTWAFKTKRSTILKKGNASDKSLVEVDTIRNRPHTTKRTSRVWAKKSPKYPTRQIRRLERKRKERENAEQVDEEFGNVFGSVAT